MNYMALIFPFSLLTTSKLWDLYTCLLGWFCSSGFASFVRVFVALTARKQGGAKANCPALSHPKP